MKTPKRPRLITKPQRFGAAWYRGDHYREKQPYLTLAAHAREHNEFREVIDSALTYAAPNSRKTSVLEIGPGDAPIAENISFRERIYIDQAQGLLNEIKTRREKYETARERVTGIKRVRPRVYVQGKLEQLPIRSRVGTIIMNEVLTHIKPNERLRVIQRLVPQTDGFVIVDRPQLPIEKLREIHRAIAGRGTFEHELRKLQATYVRFKPIIAYIRNSGFDTQVSLVSIDETQYVVFAARRKKPLQEK
ncbi:MAG: class I SAM-dependent methyltransferase [archaeon]